MVCCGVRGYQIVGPCMSVMSASLPDSTAPPDSNAQSAQPDDVITTYSRSSNPTRSSCPVYWLLSPVWLVYKPNTFYYSSQSFPNSSCNPEHSFLHFLSYRFWLTCYSSYPLLPCLLVTVISGFRPCFCSFGLRLWSPSLFGLPVYLIFWILTLVFPSHLWSGIAHVHCSTVCCCCVKHLVYLLKSICAWAELASRLVLWIWRCP